MAQLEGKKNAVPMAIRMLKCDSKYFDQLNN